MPNLGTLHGYYVSKQLTSGVGIRPYLELRAPAGIVVVLEGYQFRSGNISQIERRTARFDPAGPAFTPLIALDGTSVGLEYCTGAAALPAAIGDRMLVSSGVIHTIPYFHFGDSAAERFIALFTDVDNVAMSPSMAFSVRGDRGRRQ